MLAGCSGPIDFTPEEHRTTAAPVDDTPDDTVVEPGFVARSTTGRHVVVPEAVSSGIVVSTPHFDGRIRDLYVGDRLPLEVAQQFDQATGIAAPEGHRFVVVNAQAGVPMFPLDPEHPVTVRLVVGDRPHPLRSVFGDPERGRYSVAWECLVVVVPDDGTALLEVEDAGKTVRVDLTQGIPVEDEAWASNAGFRERRDVRFDPALGVHERTYRVEPAGFEAAEGIFRIELRPANAIFAPWNPVHQWAAPGEHWLTVPTSARMEIEGPQTVVELNLPNSFALTSASGERAEVIEPHQVTTDQVRRQQADVIPNFRVAADDDEATLTFTANGRIVVDFDNVQGVEGSFTGSGEPLRFGVTYVDQPDRFGA